MGKTDKKYECTKCEKQFSQRQSLSRHKQSICGTVKFSCSKCKKVLKRKDSLNQHMRLCKGKKELKCQVCDKEFTYTWFLQRHIKQSHTEKKSFKCLQCNLVYKREDHLKKHEMKCLKESMNNVSSVSSGELVDVVNKEHFDNLVSLSLLYNYFGEDKKDPLPTMVSLEELLLNKVNF